MPDQSGTSQPDADGITRARFRPITDGQPGEPLPVHFNPETLEYQLTNNIDQRGNSNSNKQYISQSTGKLTMQLLFDTTDTGTDVRSVTERLQALMKPKEEGRKRVAQVVQFEWGAFRFKGTFDSYKETLDYFSASGVPLRASANVTLSQQDGVFEPTEHGEPVLVSGSLTLSPVAGQVADDREVPRDVAEQNGEENLRSLSGAPLEFSLEVELLPPTAFASGAFGVSLGVGINAELGIGVGLDASFGAGVRFGAGASIGGGVGVGLGAGLGVAVSGGAGVSVGGGVVTGAARSDARAGQGGGLGTSGAAPLGGIVGAMGLAPAAGVPVTSGAFAPTGAASTGVLAPLGVAQGTGGAPAGGAGARGGRFELPPSASPLPDGPAWGAAASAGMPASLGAFAGLNARQPSRRPRRPSRSVALMQRRPEPSLHTEGGAVFDIGGRAVSIGPAGLAADVGARATLLERVRFDEE